MNEPLSSITPPGAYQVLKATWLSRKPDPASGFAAAVATFTLALGSLLYLGNVGGLGSQMAASYENVFVQHEYWRLLTTIFAHGDVGHFVANSFLFFIIGFFLYGYFGFKLFPVAAFTGGVAANAIILPTYDPQTTLVGASGVVYWMGGAWLVLYFFLSRQKNMTHRMLRSLGVAALLFMPAEAFEPQTSYRVHFVGFCLGALSGLVHYLRNRRFYISQEVHEWVFDDSDPADDLPGPEGLQ